MTDPAGGDELRIPAGGPLGDHRVGEQLVHTSALPVRWSDQDLYRHVNHARMITLVEEARIPWLFLDGLPTATLAAGAVMTDLRVRYRGQVKYSDGPIRVRMWCSRVGGAMFVAHHEVRTRSTSDSAPPQVTCEATIAAFDLATQRPRRLTAEERGYLLRYLDPSGAAGGRGTSGAGKRP